MTHAATLPLQTDEELSLELLVGLLSVDWDESLPQVPLIAPKDADVAITKLNKQINQARKHGDLPLHELQILARKTWMAHAAYEKRALHLKNELKRLELHNERMWKSFDRLLNPLWNFGPDLLPIHDELSTLLVKLEKLRVAKMDDFEKNDDLNKLQHQVHAAERKYFKEGKVMIGQEIPKGQAMCNHLLNKCYVTIRKIIETMPELDDALQERHLKLKDVADRLKLLKHLLENGSKIEPIELALHQDALKEIDSTQVDGKFLDEQGNIPQGQAILHEQLEECFDLIHDCVVLQDEVAPSDEVSSQINQLSQVRDKLGELIQSEAESLSSTAYHVVVEPLASVVSKIKRVARASNAKLHMYVQNALNYARQLSIQMEPVHPSLVYLEKEMSQIKSRLKQMRKSRNQAWIDNAVFGEERDLSGFYKVYENELMNMFKRLKEIETQKVNGQFVNSAHEAVEGQVALKSLLDECYCLAIEMMDEACL